MSASTRLNRALTLEELPPPSTQKVGWPWTEAPRVVANNGDALLPKISVITPSFNQASFLEETIRSVLLQGYPNIEYIIIDGASTDRSVDVIRKYEPWLAYWCSEKDNGQSHAINKGFVKATGDVLCWLNSDDYFLPETLSTVGRMLASGTGNYALVGHCYRVHQDGKPRELLKGHFRSLGHLLRFWKGYSMHQPSIFWRREVSEKIGWLEEPEHVIMDYDYWVRIARHFEFVNIDRPLACANHHAAMKNNDDYVNYHRELKRQARRYWPSLWSMERWLLELSMLRYSVLHR